MIALLAYVDWTPTKSSMSFRWTGAWEYDQMSGTGRVRLRKDGVLSGRFSITNGDESTLVAVRAEPPQQPIPEPPSFADKWRGRSWRRS